jgi:glucokinase
MIAVDVGGTSIKALALCGDGRIRARTVVATPRGGDAALAALCAVVAAMVDELARTGSAVSRVGIAAPGLIDPDRAFVAYAANLGWRDLDVGTRLGEQFGTPVFLDNDARAGALAEHVLAADGVRESLAFVPIGTGVSAAYYSGGAPVRGASGAIGEFGHLRAVPDGEPCACGAAGCVEVYTSAANILARYRRAGGEASSAADVVASRERDELAARVWNEGISALAVGLGALVALLDPSRIVIGGGLSLAGEALLEPARRGLADEIPWRTAPPLVASTLGAHSVLVGASLLGDEAGTAGRRARAATLARDLAAPAAGRAP